MIQFRLKIVWGKSCVNWWQFKIVLKCKLLTIMLLSCCLMRQVGRHGVLVFYMLQVQINHEACCGNKDVMVNQWKRKIWGDRYFFRGAGWKAELWQKLFLLDQFWFSCDGLYFSLSLSIGRQNNKYWTDTSRAGEKTFTPMTTTGVHKKIFNWKS